MFTIQHVFDDVELRLDRGRVDSCSVSFECCEDFICVFVTAFADEQSWRIWKKWTEAPDESSEDWRVSVKEMKVGEPGYSQI